MNFIYLDSIYLDSNMAFLFSLLIWSVILIYFKILKNLAFLR